jgi:hypothetical protein
MPVPATLLQRQQTSDIVTGSNVGCIEAADLLEGFLAKAMLQPGICSATVSLAERGLGRPVIARHTAPPSDHGWNT